MVANVLAVSVGEGDSLVLVESMKMQTPVLSEVAGTVSAMAVKPGDVVQEGDLIAVVE
ncbi:biotin/lipoyl-containing protein [Saccharopolyspora sp. NPDC000995]